MFTVSSLTILGENDKMYLERRCGVDFSAKKFYPTRRKATLAKVNDTDVIIEPERKFYILSFEEWCKYRRERINLFKKENEHDKN